MLKFLSLALAAGISVVAVMTLQKAGQSAPSEPPPAASAPMPVPVASVEIRDIAETVEFTGFLDATHKVALLPRVGGMIEVVEAPEGKMVQKGQVLFRLDQRPYQAELAEAEAVLAEVQARHALAQLQHERTRMLAKDGIAPKERLDQLAAEMESLAARMRAAEAAVASARLDIEYTVIKAPTRGRIGRTLVTAGNLVIAGQTLLTDIVATDPVHVHFDVDERTFMRLLAGVAETDRSPIKVEVALTGEEGYPRRGRLDFVSTQADRASGTARLRAIIPNPDGKLAPGLYARVRVQLSPPRPMMLVPEAAIGSAQGGRYVLVAGSDGIAQFRPVQTGPAADNGMRIVREGLEPGEAVVARGLVRPGTRIAPMPADGGETGKESES